MLTRSTGHNTEEIMETDTIDVLRDRRKRRRPLSSSTTSPPGRQDSSWLSGPIMINFILVSLLCLVSSVDARRFSVEMQLEPQEGKLEGRNLQNEKYISEAFECDEFNEEVEDSTVSRELGDSVRICIQPIRITKERGVLIRGIDRFKFEKQDEEDADGEPITQHVVRRGGKEGENTIVSCVKGSDMCVIITKFMDELFFLSGSVVGTGIVLMEFRSEEDVVATDLTRPDQQPQPFGRLRRRAQVEDTLFAGSWEVKIAFDVLQGDVQVQDDDESLGSWWSGLSTVAQNSIIAMAVILLIGLVVGISFFCFWLWKYGTSKLGSYALFYIEYDTVPASVFSPQHPTPPLSCRTATTFECP